MIRAAALACALAAGSCTAAYAADFPVPPTPNHYVTDDTGELGDSTRAALEDELRAFETSTGHQVIVWIGQSTGSVPLETWTAETAHTWKVGRKGKDDGAVLFLFMRDRKVRIEVGYGLESSLTDADADRIIQDSIVPQMKAGDTDAAVTAGVTGMLAAIDPSFSPTVSAPPAPDAGVPVIHAGGPILFLFFVLLFIVPWIFIIWRIVVAAKNGELVGGSWSSGWSGGSSSDGFSSSSSDDDFSSGGGDFGGGGASGSW